MEKNTFEGIEELEKVEENATSEPKELKEYEKLLIAERNRELLEKSLELINFGCFEQKEVVEFAFNKYEYVEGKKFKDKYSLYKNKETDELVFVFPLVENNEGSNDENKAMKPYAYDCLYIDSMDDETYLKVVKAGKNNVKTLPKTILSISWIAYVIYTALTLIVVCYYVVYNIDGALDSGETFIYGMSLGLNATGSLLAGTIVALPVLLIATLKYNDYKKN